MTLDTRHLKLLAGLIEQYIRTARPVSSADLVNRLKLDVSPATVRSALQDLEEAGFISQPHTSAGRIPTDRGYRYYVDNLRGRNITPREKSTIEQQYQQLRQEYQHLARSTAKLLALLSHSVVITNLPEAGETQLAGLRELLAQPESTSIDAVREVSSIVEALEQYLDQFDHASADTQIFIGQEIPFLNAKHTSLVVRDVHPENDQRMTLVIVGPKRMPYQRNVALLNAVSQILEDYEAQ